MADKFSKHASGLESPAVSAFAITPDDNVDLAINTRAIYVGVGGDLVVILGDDSTAVTFKSVPSGMILPIRVRRVVATNTAASSLVGLV